MACACADGMPYKQLTSTVTSTGVLEKTLLLLVSHLYKLCIGHQ